MGTGIPSVELDRIRQVFEHHPKISTAILYGSRALGTYKKGSDIDISLKGSELDFRNLNQIEEELDELLLPWMIDLNLYGTLENKELIEHINNHGIEIYPLPLATSHRT